ncbi:redox-sensing transcriptional repressor Rex [Desulfonatronovibrio hydrogenovorans]|uniref:redox-sensing transcriptional repressor Rex n=1 Tax=Desulfonatronovibrio hydrogenovorans TaxID=53245 RepID=UPI00048EEBE4|nr:redox-sensing transcriptional repressor Rex [Desulfonatronovibrio hydrogenovorans]
MDGNKKRVRPFRKINTSSRRLPVYLRTLEYLKENNVKFTSSLEIGNIQGLTPALVRKDLSQFGLFGVKGKGYPVDYLKKQLATTLGFNRSWKIILVGAASLSRVFMHSTTFNKRKMEIVSIFDNTPALAGHNVDGIPIYSVSNLEQELTSSDIDLAIIAVPPPEVQQIINRLSRIGIKGALYFASRSVVVPENMVILNKDISVELAILTYHLSPHRLVRNQT